MKPTIISNQNFYGGIAVDDKVGVANSHAYSRAVDFRKKPGQLSPLAQPRRTGLNTVVDLIQQIVQVNDGTRYALGDTGYFYAIENDNDVIVKAKLDNGAAGMLYRRDLQEMYMSSQKTVSYYGKFPNPVVQVNKYAESASDDDAAFAEGGTQTYTVPLAIAEDDLNKRSFESDIEPLVKIRVQVNTKGTGNWTLTLHDDANNVLATSTVTSANITSNTYLDFTFSSQIRLYVKPSARTYHYHLTSTVADGTVKTVTANDLSDSDFEIYADRLVDTVDGFHPMAQFLQYVCICNERYLSVWEPLQDVPSNAEWERHRLDFGDGYTSNGLAVTDEYLVISCERRSTTGNRDFQEGRLFFWDGLSETYSFFIEITEGSPSAMYTYQNVVYMIINGALYVWPGGKDLIKLRTLLNTDTEFTNISDTTRVYPNMMGVRRNILLFGYPSVTASQTMEHGVFSWGSVDKNFPTSFGYNYILSTGTKTYDGSNTLKIGCVRSFGDTLYTSWRDDTQPVGFRYGIDIVDNSSTPAYEGAWEARIFDGEAVFKQKVAHDMKLTCVSLPDGYTLRMKYKIDRGSWVYPEDGVLDNEGQTYKTAQIGARNHEVQIGFDWETDPDNRPTEPFIVTCMALDTDLLVNEAPFAEDTF